MVEAPARAASKYLSGLFASQKALPDCKGTKFDVEPGQLTGEIDVFDQGTYFYLIRR